MLDEIAGNFLAGQRGHEVRVIPDDFIGVGELFSREYREQNKKCEMTEAAIADVYEKCKGLLSRKVRPDLMGILDDIYLGTLAKLRIRSAQVYGNMQELENRYMPIIDEGLPKKSAELRVVQIQEDISQTDTALASCRSSIMSMRARLDGQELRGMTPSTREHLEELAMALDKKTAFTEYYGNKARERFERGDFSSANQLVDTFREMARSLQSDARQLSVLLDRYMGSRANPQAEQFTNDELAERADLLLKSEEILAHDLLGKLNQRQGELSALKAINNPDDERRRTAYLIDVLAKNDRYGRGIIGEALARAQDDAKRVSVLFNELRRKNEERRVNLLHKSYSPDLVAQKKLEADYAVAVRSYGDSVQRVAVAVGRLNDAYISLFPEALQK